MEHEIATVVPKEFTEAITECKNWVHAFDIECQDSEQAKKFLPWETGNEDMCTKEY